MLNYMGLCLQKKKKNGKKIDLLIDGPIWPTVRLRTVLVR